MASVEFCKQCGASLPRADILIRDGQQTTGEDYECPKCKQPAGTSKTDQNIEPQEDYDIIVKDGEVKTE
jgi:hypothetical protein